MRLQTPPQAENGLLLVAGDGEGHQQRAGGAAAATEQGVKTGSDRP
jgi:hypothetical protein